MTEIAVPLSEINPEKGQSLVSQEKTRKNRAMKIVNKYVLISGGIGFIPAPFFDQIAIAGTLAKMLSDLCHVYDTKLSDQKIKAAVAAVLGGAHSDWITYYLTNYISKFVPSVNVVAGIVTRPLISGAITYAIGRLFVHHLESGAWLK
jgi:uncharacterized protein (DUF697 family)